MNNLLKNRLDKSQGTLARVLDRMPRIVQTSFAQVLSYPYSYPHLDPFIKCMLAIQHKQGKAGLIGDNISQARQQFEENLQRICVKRTKVKRVEDIRLSLKSGSVYARHYHPAPQKRLPLVVFYHGGGFLLGSVQSHDEVCRLLAVYAQVQVLSIEYPLAPEVGPERVIEVCEDALAWAYQNRKKLKILKNRIAVAGDSAGGNIATVVAQKSMAKNHVPRAQLLIYPVIDFKNRYPSYMQYKEGLILTAQDVDKVIDQYAHQYQIALDDPLISPLYGNLKKLAPTFLVTAQYDVLHDEGELYAAQLQQHGTRVHYKNYEDQTHGFVNLTPISSQAKKHTIEIFRDFRKFWNKQDGLFKGFFLGRFWS